MSVGDRDGLGSSAGTPGVSVVTSHVRNSGQRCVVSLTNRGRTYRNRDRRDGIDPDLRRRGSATTFGAGEGISNGVSTGSNGRVELTVAHPGSGESTAGGGGHQRDGIPVDAEGPLSYDHNHGLGKHGDHDGGAARTTTGTVEGVGNGVVTGADTGGVESVANNARAGEGTTGGGSTQGYRTSVLALSGNLVDRNVRHLSYRDDYVIRIRTTGGIGYRDGIGGGGEGGYGDGGGGFTRRPAVGTAAGGGKGNLAGDILTVAGRLQVAAERLGVKFATTVAVTSGHYLTFDVTRTLLIKVGIGGEHRADNGGTAVQVKGGRAGEVPDDVAAGAVLNVDEVEKLPVDGPTTGDVDHQRGVGGGVRVDPQLGDVVELGGRQVEHVGLVAGEVQGHLTGTGRKGGIQTGEAAAVGAQLGESVAEVDHVARHDVAGGLHSAKLDPGEGVVSTRSDAGVLGRTVVHVQYVHTRGVADLDVAVPQDVNPTAVQEDTVADNQGRGVAIVAYDEVAGSITSDVVVTVDVKVTTGSQRAFAFARDHGGITGYKSVEVTDDAAQRSRSGGRAHTLTNRLIGAGISVGRRGGLIDVDIVGPHRAAGWVAGADDGDISIVAFAKVRDGYVAGAGQGTGGGEADDVTVEGVLHVVSTGGGEVGVNDDGAVAGTATVGSIGTFVDVVPGSGAVRAVDLAVVEAVVAVQLLVGDTVASGVCNGS